MWTCQKCGEQLEDTFDSCWKCSGPKESPAATAGAATEPQWRMDHEIFRSSWSSWEDLLVEASAFASKLGPERVISISHSADQRDGVVVVWYWTDTTRAT